MKICYVDDFVHAGKKGKSQVTKRLMDEEGKNFEVNNLGEVGVDRISKILGLEIERDRSKKQITLSQKDYCKKIIEIFGFWECSPNKAPIANDRIPEPREGALKEEEMSQLPEWSYSEAVGSIGWLRVTRPDIKFALSVISRFQSNPGPEHFQLVKYLFRYLRGTYNQGITYDGNIREPLKAYVNASFASSKPDMKSQGGNVLILAGGEIVSHSGKQTVVA
jgi:hypothetical protein